MITNGVSGDGGFFEVDTYPLKMEPNQNLESAEHSQDLGVFQICTLSHGSPMTSNSVMAELTRILKPYKLQKHKIPVLWLEFISTLSQELD